MPKLQGCNESEKEDFFFPASHLNDVIESLVSHWRTGLVSTMVEEFTMLLLDKTFHRDFGHL